MTKQRHGNGRFGVEFDGLDLPAETADRIAAAIQRAVLTEIASLDIGPKYAVSLLPPAPDATSRALPQQDPIPPTQGITISVGATA